MAEEAVRIAALIAAAMTLSIGAIVALCRVAPALALVDVPGGRKAHDGCIPLVGGLGVFVSYLTCAWIIGLNTSVSYFVFALAIVIAAGLWDDIREISPRIKFAIQIAASAIMIWGAGIELRSVGDLLGFRPIGLSVFVVPMTVFAVVGVVNSINMMDGMDGLAGSVAMTAFAWYAAVAANSGLQTQFYSALMLCGALGGFLLFNLRFPWQPRARVFLGDAGSLMIGFALAWFAIDLTQGQGRTFPPIAALWIVLLPLADCVSVMSRRVARGKSPFVADRQHIHHYLEARGLTHGQALAALMGLSTVFGAVGFFGWAFHVPEPVLFWPFFFGFFGYHFWAKRAWKRLEARTAIETAAFAPLVEEDEEPLPAA